MIGAVAAGVEALGPEWDGLFEGGPGVQSRRAWFAATEAAALPAGARAHVLTVVDGAPAAVLPMQVGPGARMVSLTSPYTVLFQPLLAPGADALGIGRALGRMMRGSPVTILEALDPDWPCLAPLLAGFRRAGLVAARFDQFGNWHLGVEGLGWAGYLAGRPGALRETIRRKGRLAAKDASVRFEVVRGVDGLDRALAAYEGVYARSWKVPEPYEGYNAALLVRMAALGAMRLGVLWQGDVALAAQYWTVMDGVATVLKLAHDEGSRALSPGTLLTAHMIRGLLEEGVTELDFGRGDDPYKAQWTGLRRPRIGVLLANPLLPGGLVALARHSAGHLRRRLRAIRG